MSTTIDTILKLSGHKDMKSFYKEFPDEASFMAKHGKAFAKAQRGAKIKKAQIGTMISSSPITSQFNPVNFRDYYDQTYKGLTGRTKTEEEQRALELANLQAQQTQAANSGKGQGIEGMLSQLGQIAGGMSAKKGKNVKKAQTGESMSPIAPISTEQGWGNYYNNLPAQKLDYMEPNQVVDWGEKIGQGIPYLSKFIKGAQMLKDEKKKMLSAKQWNKVTDVNLLASQLTPEPIEHKYLRPEDVINTGEKFFPIYGVGTDALAKKGKTIPKAQSGFWAGANEFAGSGGTQLLGNFAEMFSGGESGGSNIGSVIGEGAGTLLFGPAGGMVGNVLGTVAGNLLDQRPEKTKKYQQNTSNNINQMAMGKGMQGLFNMNNAYMASGGNVSNMETEGELRIGKGGAKSLSYNPFLPDGGETIEFTGPSHAQGGMPVAYGRNPVEVEGGEPAVKLQSGGTDEDLVVFGDLTIPGTKQTFKKKVKDISKETTKDNKKAEKALLSIEDLSPTNSFDKLKLNSAKATLMGTSQKNEARAIKIKKLASLQEAINQTADEMGMDANALSKGAIKMAKKGASIPKAQVGSTVREFDPSLVDIYNADIEALNNQLRNESNSKIKNEVVAAIRNKELELDSYLHAHGRSKRFVDVGRFDQRDPDILPYDDIQQQSSTNIDIPEITPIQRKTTTFPSVQQKESEVIPYDFIQNNQQYNVDIPGITPIQQNPYEVPLKLEPWQTSLDFGKNINKNKTFQLGRASSATKPQSSTLPTKPTMLGEVVVTAPRINKSYTPELPPSEEIPYDFIQKEFDNIQNNKEAIAEIDEKSKIRKIADEVAKKIKGEEDGKVRDKFRWKDLMAFSPLLPYFRPSDTEGLDPRQLMGEMFALTDKEEPVQAQFFHPQLSTPYAISFQDQLNEITAEVNAARRNARNNPAAQAMIASQAYSAKSKVLADQFRANQAMSQDVYGKNRELMNTSQLQNLGILDTQYERQSKAKSNTKAQLQAALSSISDKYLKNELNNKTLATYENLYNYRFDDRGRKQNWNQPAQWNMEGDTYAGTSGREGLPTGYEYVYNSRGERIDVRRIPRTSTSVEDDNNKVKNGGNIARAIKSL